VLDGYSPDIEVEEIYSNHPGQAACYELRVELLDSSGDNVVGKSFTYRDNMEASQNEELRRVCHTWRDPGPGVRFVKFYHGGFAESMESGWLGARMTGGRVTVRYPGPRASL